MAMFDNPKKELEKLESQLLQEEDWFEKELAQAKALIGEEAVKKPKSQPGEAAPAKKSAAAPARKPAPAKKPTPAQKVRNSTRYDVDLDAQSKELEAKPKSNRGLIILAVLETLGIVGVVAYWLVFLL